MHMTARRIQDGKALKDAMDAKGMTLTGLAGETKRLDPNKRGVSFQLIGFLTAPPDRGVSGTRGRRARRWRDTTSPETATLIELALDARPGQLFTREQVADPGDPDPGADPFQAEAVEIARRVHARKEEAPAVRFQPPR
jgi:hypothetical protein